MHRKAPRLRAMSHEFEFGQRLAKADASSILGPAAVAVAVGVTVGVVVAVAVGVALGVTDGVAVGVTVGVGVGVPVCPA